MSVLNRMARPAVSAILPAVIPRARKDLFRPLMLLSAAVLLRGIVPAGYMPAAVGSGFLFELCPEGVPAGFMQLLSGVAGHDHHDHGQDNVDGHHCPIGHMLLSATAVDDTPGADIVDPPQAAFAVSGVQFSLPSRAIYEPRGPPA